MRSTLARTVLLSSLAAVSFAGSPAQDTPTSGSATPPAASNPVTSTLTTSFYVAGISARTTNASEATGQGEIPKLWQRFFQEGIAEQIPHRSAQAVMAVYSDYASDEKGEYTYLLGIPVDSIEGLPKEMVYRKIPAGPYAVVTTQKGPLQEIIPAVWKQIWAMSPATLGGKRSFIMDYEVYDERAADPSNGQAEIHLGLAPAAPAK